LIYFSGRNKFQYIEKRVFEKFLENNNTLDIRWNLLNCSDINEFEWILQQSIRLRDKLQAHCFGGRDLWDLGLYIFYLYISFNEKVD
jgi:hypothetical protein